MPAKKFKPILYEWGSKEYEDYISDLHAAKGRQNRRNRFTYSLGIGEPSPFGTEIPCKPSCEDLALIQSDRTWRRSLRYRGDKWWFSRIDTYIEENFYRAKVSQMIWWDLCDWEPLNNLAWHERFKSWDFDTDLFCDWDLVEFALHCCGYPPAKARALSIPSQGRERMKALKQESKA